MTQNINQFAITPEKGTIRGAEINVLSCRIDPNTVATDLQAATAVKIVDATGSNIIVDKALETEAIFGFIVLDARKNNYVAGDMVRVAFKSSVMLMEAGAALVSGASLEIDDATNKVITSVGVNKIIGVALRKAIADGDIIPVLIETPLINQV